MRARPVMAMVALLCACGSEPRQPEAPGPGAEAPASRAVAADPTPTGSLYALPYRLEDASGQTIGLDVQRGHPTIVAMFYASCTQACPLMIGKVQSILAGLDEAARADTRVLLVSIDPEHDTPAALAAAAERQHVSAPVWVLSRPSEHDLRPLAALLDVRYAAQDDGAFNHTSPITLLDREGRIVLRQAAVTDPNDPVVREIAALAAR